MNLSPLLSDLLHRTAVLCGGQRVVQDSVTFRQLRLVYLQQLSSVHLYLSPVCWLECAEGKPRFVCHVSEESSR